MGNMPENGKVLPGNPQFSSRDSTSTIAVSASNNSEKIDPKDTKETRMSDLFRPFFYFLRLGGLLFADTTRASDGTPTAIKRVTQAFLRLYCTFVLVICWFDVGIVLYATHYAISVSFEEMSNTINNISRIVFTIQMCVIYCIFYRASHSDSGISSLFDEWNKLTYVCVIPNCKGHKHFRNMSRQRQKWLLLISVVHLTVQVTLSMLGRLDLGEIDKVAGVDIAKRIGFCFICFAFTVPIYFFAAVASTMALDFQHLKHDLSIVAESKGCGQHIESLRRRHQALCKLLKIADSIFSPFILMTITLSVVQVLFEVFMLQAEIDSGSSINAMAAGSYILWICTYTSQIALVISMGASVNEAAHSPELILFSIDQSNLAIAECRQLQLFISKITGCKIGFTAGGICVVERGAIIEIFGAYITYQILIFEVRLDFKVDNTVEKILECKCLDSIMFEVIN